MPSLKCQLSALAAGCCKILFVVTELFIYSTYFYLFKLYFDKHEFHFVFKVVKYIVT